MEGRLLEVTMEDPFANLALEEAIFSELGQPVLRVWENQESVVLGRAQMAGGETDLEYCASNGIPVVRRFTAGGAVYNGPGNLNWSFFVPRGRFTEVGAKAVFESFAGVVVAALADNGFQARFSPPNGVSGRGGKVSGMAAYISRESVLCHGTLLHHADLEKVQRLTRPSEETLPRRYPRSRFTEVTNAEVSVVDFVDRLADRSGLELRKSRLTPREVSREAALEGKYRSSGWNLGDPFSGDYL
jgi:lipoate---protein ligase